MMQRLSSNPFLSVRLLIPSANLPSRLKSSPKRTQTGKRYSIPYRTVCANRNQNLYVAGRNTPADKGGWDLLRVIPSCAVTGEAAGVAAAMQIKNGVRPKVDALQQKLREKGVLLDPQLFAKREK